MKNIADKSPVNKTASLVTSKGVHYKESKKIETADQDTPIQTRPVKNGENLTGNKRGRLKVVGLAKNQKSRWVVRCDCGVYTLRSAKAIKNENNEQDRCEKCRHLAYLKRKEIYERTGKNYYWGDL